MIAERERVGEKDERGGMHACGTWALVTHAHGRTEGGAKLLCPKLLELSVHV